MIKKVIIRPAELKTSTSPKPIVVIVISTIHKQSPQSQPSVMRYPKAPNKNKKMSSDIGAAQTFK